MNHPDAMDPGNCCQTCKHLGTYESVLAEKPYVCLRHPPVVRPLQVLGDFPQVLPDWVCGEYDRGDQTVRAITRKRSGAVTVDGDEGETASSASGGGAEAKAEWDRQIKAYEAKYGWGDQFHPPDLDNPQQMRDWNALIRAQRKAMEYGY